MQWFLLCFLVVQKRLAAAPAFHMFSFLVVSRLPVAAARTLQMSPPTKHECPARYFQPTAVDKSPGDFRSSAFDDPPEGRAGNAHFAGSLFLRQTLKIGQSQGFKLI
jgi:hypothetical protein